jgi:hypothetical protein
MMNVAQWSLLFSKNTEKVSSASILEKCLILTVFMKFEINSAKSCKFHTQMALKTIKEKRKHAQHE